VVVDQAAEEGSAMCRCADGKCADMQFADVQKVNCNRRCRCKPVGLILQRFSKLEISFYVNSNYNRSGY